MKKAFLLFFLFLPLLSCPLTIRQYDWYRVIDWFDGRGWWPWSTFHAKAGDRIYCYYRKESDPRYPLTYDEADITLIDSKGKIKGWYWLTDWQEIFKIQNDRLCIWLENRRDDRYK